MAVDHHDGRQPLNTQDGLVRVEVLADRDDGMITFAWENQGNWTARCEVNKNDPPVYSDAPTLVGGDVAGFTEVCPSLNHFLTTLCLQEAMFSSGHVVAIESPIAAERVARIPLEPLWLNGPYAYGNPDYHFFTTPDRDALIADLGGSLWVGSSVHEVLELLAPEVEYQENS